MRPYRVAETYDPMTQPLMPYAQVAALLAARLGEAVPSPRAVLDVACGTGGLTLALARLGYRVTGLDLSPEMLALAREKAAAQGLDIPFVCQDMRDVRTELFDAVTCFYGGLNFLDSPQALRESLTSIYQALKPGGRFLFEQFDPDYLRLLFTGTQAADFGDFYTITQSECDAAGMVRHHVTFFLREPDGRYRREEELHTIRLHPRAEVEQSLADVGFVLRSVEPLAPLLDAPLLEQASLFVAEKPT